jgi:hypothetical protein
VSNCALQTKQQIRVNGTLFSVVHIFMEKVNLNDEVITLGNLSLSKCKHKHSGVAANVNNKLRVLYYVSQLGVVGQVNTDGDRNFTVHYHGNTMSEQYQCFFNPTVVPWDLCDTSPLCLTFSLNCHEY